MVLELDRLTRGESVNKIIFGPCGHGIIRVMGNSPFLPTLAGPHKLHPWPLRSLRACWISLAETKEVSPWCTRMDFLGWSWVPSPERTSLPSRMPEWTEAREPLFAPEAFVSPLLLGWHNPLGSFCTSLSRKSDYKGFSSLVAMESRVP